MGPGTQPINHEHRRRFDVLRELGCVVSTVFFQQPGTPGQVHHLLSGGRRIGHEATICLHPWYHQGEPPFVKRFGRLVQLRADEATQCYGPSLALDRPAFEARFGTEHELLEMQNALIAAYRRAIGETL